jgi:uncharacterized membrane protein YhhN
MLAFVPYVVIGLFHLVTLAVGWTDGSTVSKLALMPALILAVLLIARRRRTPIVIIVTIGLTFSWIGDVLLNQPTEIGFLLGLGAFFVAHVAYLVLFVKPMRTRRPPIFALVYVVWWVVLVLTLAPYLGPVLLGPVVAYGLVLGAMAAAALGTNRIAAVGALIFAVSDTLLAFKFFYPNFTFWQIDVAIMLPYLVGQGLIALGAVIFVRNALAQPRELSPAPQ